jgi:hypothetical protein
MPRSLSCLFLAGALLISFCEAALGWSSPGSRTYNDLQQLSLAIEIYRGDFGRLPPPEHYWAQLEIHRRVFETGPPCDRWERPFIYRAPGKNGEYDLYSVGPDGIDQDGAQDDISLWAGVNEGFHWKATWPAGRFTIAAGGVLGIGALLLYRFLGLRVALPLAGSLLCLGITIGCRLLMHPGIVRSRNDPLAVCSNSALLVFAILAVILIANVRGRSFVKSRNDLTPQN